MPDPLWTEWLADRAQEGDEASYEALFARVQDRLRVYIQIRLGRLGQHVTAEDVLQETYVTAHQRFADFRGGEAGTFRGWLYRIADSRLADLVDHFQARKRKPPAGSVPISQVGGVSRPQPGPSTEAGLEEDLGRLRAAISALPPDQEEVILLTYFHGMSLRQLAEHLDVSVKRVRTLLAKATFQLGAALGEDPSQRSD